MDILMGSGGRQDPSSWTGRGQVPWCLRACSALGVGPDTANIKQEPRGLGQAQAEESELVLPTMLPKPNLNDGPLSCSSMSFLSLFLLPKHFLP